MGRLKEWVAALLALFAGLAMGTGLWAQDFPLGKQRGVDPSVLPVSVDDEAQAPNQNPPAKPPSPPMSQEAKEKEIEQLKKMLKDAQERLDKIAPAEPAPAHDPYSPEVSPFSFGDMSWSPAGYTPSKSSLKWGPFTGEIRMDAALHMDLNRPSDHTISGSSEEFRSDELQMTQIGFGGDFYYEGAQARLMTQFGMYSQTTPRNDPSASRGQWNLDNAYRYISEAYGGYHINWMGGLNIQAGIFMSYVGLWSYYNFDNWTYQPSYVSSNTPWFFNGMRIQWFPSEKVKIEPWLVNGWQAYGMFNKAPGVGLQVRWWPDDSFSILGNQYYGTDTLGLAHRNRFHTDDSAMMRYYEDKEAFLDRMAACVTFDYGFEHGTGPQGGFVHPDKQYFLGFMTYDRMWFYHNMFAFTVGGGWINNPGRYLVLTPPVNGATAFTGSQGFTQNPGDQFKAWDFQLTTDYMPTENVTFRLEFTRRFSSVNYFFGQGGGTPPGGNQGAPGSLVAGFSPDLVKSENIISLALMIRY